MPEMSELQQAEQNQLLTDVSWISSDHWQTAGCIISASRRKIPADPPEFGSRSFEPTSIFPPGSVVRPASALVTPLIGKSTYLPSIIAIVIYETHFDLWIVSRIKSAVTLSLTS